ncbi:MAG: hypothetical protein J6X72_07165 [Clostridia bacterium]|nr:hypothetical protein [Clostridia bacterium]
MKLSTSTGDFKRVGATMPERIRLIAEAGFKHINLELTDAPLELILQAEKLLYATGKYLLEQYNAFED